MDTISRSVPLSTLMMTCATADQAINVLELAGAVLHSRTKALVRTAGIVVDGAMPVEGVQSAMFFYAFKDCKPHVLKVLTRQQNAAIECQLWRDVCERAPNDDVFCVPVAVVELALKANADDTRRTQVRSAPLAVDQEIQGVSHGWRKILCADR